MPTLGLWAGVNVDVVDTLPFDPYLAAAAVPSSPAPVSPPKEVDALMTLPTLVLGETVPDLDGPVVADPKDSQVECGPSVADPQASAHEAPCQPDAASEPAATSDGTSKTDGFNALDHKDQVLCHNWSTVSYKPRIHELGTIPTIFSLLGVPEIIPNWNIVELSGFWAPPSWKYQMILWV